MQPLKLDSCEESVTPASNTVLDISPQKAVDAINQLQSTFLQFSKVTDERMSRMESSISQILDKLDNNRDDTMNWSDMLNEKFRVDTSTEKPPFDRMSPICQPLQQLPFAAIDEVSEAAESETASIIETPTSALSLKIVGLESRWFTKRSLTPFQVHLLDNSSGRKFMETDDCFLNVHLMSGHGVQVDHYLVNPENLQFPFVEGAADVAGLRFLAVSSRNGGHFRLQFSVSGAPSPVATILSDELHVLSERLKNEHKAESILDLSPDDPLVRVPGIGKKYAAKLKEQGLEKVRDLAAIDTSPSARARRLDILGAVRKDRGALTEAKLVEMLRDAKTVVKRDDADDEPEEEYEPPAKRLKYDDFTANKTIPLMDPSPMAFDPSMMMNVHAFEPTLSFF